MNLKTLLVAFLMTICMMGHSAIFTVTSTADSGPGTLRQAILNANATPALDTIRFMIVPLGNTFESSGLNSWAVIQINTVLPTISNPVFIDGSTQTNTNTGSMSGRIVGADSITQADIPYPDVWLVPSASFAFPNNNTGVMGNGLTINATDVTIRGLCISGFGNTHSSSSNASHHADVAVARSATARNIDFLMYDCFLSSDPRGNYPALISGSNRRRTKGGSIVIGGNNHYGVIRNNYMAYAGTYHIHFNGNFDHLSVGPNSVTLPTRYWTVTQNILIGNGKNTLVTTAKAADAINTMRCKRFTITCNYIEDSEQVGIDLGYNADSNFVANNTITGMVNTTAAPPLAGMRIGLGSQRDTFYRNVIYNNTVSAFKGGIWIDRSSVNTGTVTSQDNSYNLIQENVIFNNSSSAIVLSDNGNTVQARFNTISRNSTYNNAGLGIDIGFPTANSTLANTNVNVNDDGDGDAGINDQLNFPIIDSAKAFATNIHIWGKAPAGSTVEFFLRDAQANQHNGRVFNYGEGKTFIGSAVEGSAADLRTGTGSYNVDGNVATNNQNMFYFIVPYSGGFNSDSLTATATLNGNTSEFGPKNFSLEVLDCYMTRFSGSKHTGKNILDWEAICDRNFAYFLVEHSTDGRSYLSVGKLYPAAEGRASYSFTHLVNAGTKNYYRLKLVSNNDRYKYSHVIVLNHSGQDNGIEMSVVENPFRSRLSLTIGSDVSGEVKVKIMNANGVAVATQTYKVVAGKNLITMNEVSTLPPGYYQVVIDHKDKKHTLPVIKQ